MNKPAPKGRNDGHDMDHSEVVPGIFIGSDLCKGGTCLIHGEEFKRLGVSFEVNLSDENNELPPKDIAGYLWIPVVDGFAPSLEQMEMGVAFIHSAQVAGKSVYVHCRNGHGRSPTLVAAYLKRHKNMKVDQALKLIKSKRSEIHIERSQTDALDKF
jgi:hypothetical protein